VTVVAVDPAALHGAARARHAAAVVGPAAGRGAVGSLRLDRGHRGHQQRKAPQLPPHGRHGELASWQRMLMIRRPIQQIVPGDPSCPSSSLWRGAGATPSALASLAGAVGKSVLNGTTGAQRQTARSVAGSSRSAEPDPGETAAEWIYPAS
jgi:hypothetical protein